MGGCKWSPASAKATALQWSFPEAPDTLGNRLRGAIQVKASTGGHMPPALPSTQNQSAQLQAYAAKPPLSSEKYKEPHGL